MVEPAYGSTLIKASRPEPELIEITAFGDTAPRYIEKWRGWLIEEWLGWDWIEWNFG